MILFQEKIPTVRWLGLTHSFVHQKFMRELAEKPSFAKHTATTLRPQ